MGITDLTVTPGYVYGAFFEALGEATANSFVPLLTTYINAGNKETVKHRWLRRGPVMEEWTGTRALSRLDTDGFQLSSKLWSSGIEVGTDELRRDESGQVDIRINELAVDAALHPERRLTEIIEAAPAGVCYDGEFFFDTDHPYGDRGNAVATGTQSNDISATGLSSATAPTYTEASQIIIKGVKQILSLKDERGLPRNQNLRNFGVMVPIGLMDAFLGAVSTQFVANGVTNPLAGLQGNGFSIQVLINSHLTWTDKVMVFARDGVMRPFLFQEEYPTKLDMLGAGTEQEIMHRRHVYTAERMYDIGYGRYEGACLVTLVAA